MNIYNFMTLDFLEIMLINTYKTFSFPELKKNYKDLNDVVRFQYSLWKKRKKFQCFS